VDKLTPGVSVKFDRVDPGTKKVTVVTADGIVPIEAVSQGTTSLLGWIGVLLQRIYEVYGDEEDPLDRYCIVLIDEIDAHMHPEWQQKLVYQLGALFPKIQFIATTHSPLIVGGMAAGNIQRLVRDQEGRVIQMDNITDLMTAGRVDQILTTPLFGLESARDALTAATLARYTELAAKDKLNAKEDEQLRKDAAFLKTRLPSPLERERSRKAFALLQSALDDHLSKLPEQEAKSLMDEVKVQIQESISGSRRPE
jgi:predicted ATP-binding protein involved in virulence